MRPARILFVSTSTTRGGAEKILCHLAEGLNSQQFSVSGVISLKSIGAYGDILRDKGVTVESLNLSQKNFLSALFTLREIIKKERPDIVQAFMYQAVQLARIAKVTSSVPFKLVSSHRVNPRTRSQWTLWVDRLLKAQDDLVIAECEASRSFLIHHQGYFAEKVKMIHNGITISDKTFLNSERLEKRQSLGIDTNDFLIGTAGRLHQQKGHSTLIQAMELLKDRHNLRCVILGEGPERGALEREISKRGLQKQVCLLGERTDIPSWMMSLDAFVLPSLWEGFPSVILEAMAAGLPIIATEVDGIPEMIENGKTGLLIPPKNPKELASKIGLLLDSPPLFRQTLGQAAKNAVLKRFTLAQMLASYEMSYQKLLTGNTFSRSRDTRD